MGSCLKWSSLKSSTWITRTVDKKFCKRKQQFWNADLRLCLHFVKFRFWFDLSESANFVFNNHTNNFSRFGKWRIHNKNSNFFWRRKWFYITHLGTPSLSNVITKFSISRTYSDSVLFCDWQHLFMQDQNKMKIFESRKQNFNLDLDPILALLLVTKFFYFTVIKTHRLHQLTE